MINKDKYWEDLVAKAHEGDKESPFDFDGAGGLGEKDYNWILYIKRKLFTAFSYDAFDKNEARLRLEHRMASNKSRIYKLYTSVLLRAAVIVMALASGATIHMLVSDYSTEISYNEIEVPYGQMSQVRLADGSSVWLNSGSTLKYPSSFNKKKREVFINGEAYFEVEKDKSCPFVVNSNKFSIQVLGTSFNVTSYAQDKASNVTLVEGKIKLFSEEKNWSAILKPGQSADLDQGRISEISNVETDFYTSWKNGKITFRQEALGDIALKLERWYNTEIQFKEESIKKLKFSGTLIKNKPVDQVLKSICIIDDRIEYKIENRVDNQDIIWISKKKRPTKK